MGSGPNRPVKTHGPGGAAHVESPSHGPRPGPSIFQRMGRGSTQPITFPNVLARPGPANHNFQIAPARPGPDKRPMTSPGTYPGCTTRGESRPQLRQYGQGVHKIKYCLSEEREKTLESDSVNHANNICHPAIDDEQQQLAAATAV